MFSFIFDAGRPLTVQERTIFKPFFANIVLDGARVVDGRTPFWLRRNMCAVVLGNRIFLRVGAYQAGTKSGIELLGHELMHVSQFLHGMTLWRYIWSCRHGYRNSIYEREAYAKGYLIARSYQ